MWTTSSFKHNGQYEPVRQLRRSPVIRCLVEGNSIPDVAARESVLPWPRARRRENLPTLFRSFDFANPDMHVPARHETTVPQQALFLLNSPLVAEAARALDRMAAGETGDDEVQWVRRAYRIALGREPGSQELDSARTFLAAASSASALVRGPGPASPPLSPRQKLAQALLMCNEFAFID